MKTYYCVGVHGDERHPVTKEKFHEFVSDEKDIREVECPVCGACETIYDITIIKYTHEKNH